MHVDVLQRRMEMDSASSFFQDEAHPSLTKSDNTVHYSSSKSQVNMKEQVECFLKTLGNQCSNFDDMAFEEIRDQDLDSLAAPEEDSNAGSYLNLKEDLEKVYVKFRLEPGSHVDDAVSTCSQDERASCADTLSNSGSYFHLHEDIDDIVEKFHHDPEDNKEQKNPMDRSQNGLHLDMIEHDERFKSITRFKPTVSTSFESSKECSTPEAASPNGSYFNMHEEIEVCMEILRLEQAISELKL
ncbi:hypothetical protein QZH41_002801 [Actinostola sp. cb2023]|nr:hypothetical protein QZH41_002801 [Actinostola sp. cb2023]